MLFEDLKNDTDKKTLVLLDDIYKKTSLKNRIALFSSTLIHLAKIQMNKTEEYKIKNNLEFKNKRQKMIIDIDNLDNDNEPSNIIKKNFYFFSINKEFKEKIDPYIQEYSEAFLISELTSEIVKTNNKFSIFNTYQIKVVENNSFETDEDYFFKNSIYISKQNGLNTDLFIKALEIQNRIIEKNKMPINYQLINNYFKFFETKKMDLKDLQDVKKLYTIINELNKLKEN